MLVSGGKIIAIDEIKTTSATLSGDGIWTELGLNTSATIDPIKNDVSSLSSTVSGFSRDIQSISSKTNELSGYITTVSGNVDNIKNNVNTISGYITTISGDLNEVSSKVEEIEPKITELSGNLDTVSGALATEREERIAGDIAVENEIDEKIDARNFATVPWVESLFTFKDVEIEYDNLEDRNIWIIFKFLDKSYNPQTSNLAIGTVESNGKNRGFKADWQLVDANENIWLWGVTEGTDLSLAFRYGNGESSFPLLVSDNYRDIPEEMWRQEGYNSLEAILADCDDWWTDEIIEGNVGYTGDVEIVSWDLTKATSLNNLLGDNTYWRCSVVGTIPSLTSNTSKAVYLFGRLYDIKTVGKITLPHLNGDIQKLMFAMTSLQDIPEIELGGTPQELDRLFWQDCNVSKSSIEATYNYLNTNFGSFGHTNTFTKCGLYKDPTALDNIPASWGGNLA